MTEQQQALVSVVIPAYNATDYIQQSIDSVLAQTYQHFEVIVVDDGSTDDTLALLEANYRHDARVKVVSQENSGPAPARNRGIAMATGEYVQFLDSDEYFTPNKLEESLKLFQQHPDCSVVYGHGIPVKPDGVTPIPMHFEPLPAGDVLCEWLTGTMAGGRYGVTSSVMVKREALAQVGVFEKLCSPAEDFDLWVRLANQFKFVPLQEKYIYYRRRPDGIHNDRLKMALARLRVYERADLLSRRRECLSDAQYQRLLARRWAVVARVYWDDGQRLNAFKNYRTASQYDRALLYTFIAVLSVIIPSNWFDFATNLRSNSKA